MEKKFKIKMTSMPNFLYLDMPSRPKQDGIQNIIIPVTDLNIEEATQYGEEMKLAFIEHWKESKTKNNENESISR